MMLGARRRWWRISLVPLVAAAPRPNRTAGGPVPAQAAFGFVSTQEAGRVVDFSQDAGLIDRMCPFERDNTA